MGSDPHFVKNPNFGQKVHFDKTYKTNFAFLIHLKIPSCKGLFGQNVTFWNNSLDNLQKGFIQRVQITDELLDLTKLGMIFAS